MWLAALRRDTDLVVPEPVSSLHLDHVTVINVEGIPEPRICILFHWINGRFLDDGLTTAHQYADAVLDSLTEATAIVPAIWPLEVVNVLLVAERRNRLHESDSVRFLSLLSQLPIQVEQAWPTRSMNDLLALGRANDLSSYDASYLDLAMTEGLPIATLDQKLVAAAKRIDIPIFVA
jgi:predicted nucleic acid-binding protein